MATFPTIFSAIGRRFTTYVHSFLLFLSSGFFGRGLVNLLLHFRGQRDQGTSGLLQPGPSDSNTQSLRQTAASRDPAASEGEENTTDANNITTTDTSTTATSSEAEEDQKSLQATDADDEREPNDDNNIYETDDEMTAGGKRGALTKIVPALPLVPIPTRRKDASSSVKTQKQQDTDLVDLSDELSGMKLGGQLAPIEKKQESAASASGGAKSTRLSLQVVTNGATPAATTNNTVEVKGENGNELPIELTPREDLGKEVLRSNPVPIVHDVSQNSNLKENAKPNDPPPATSIAEIATVIRAPDPEETPEQAAERELHSGFMRDALDMARLALKTNETPVGCVLVYKNRVIAKGMNATNITRNGTRHAELMAISALLSYTKDSDFEAKKKKGSFAKGKKGNMPLGDRTNTDGADPDESAWGDVDPRDGHIYPYGQKLHPSPRVDRSIINECVLYVTVEPCIMCASLLRQLGIKKVYFGAVNDKFGGTGGVFRIHKNSPQVAASYPPSPGPQTGSGFAKPILERRPALTANIPDAQGSGSGSSCCDDKSQSGGDPPIDPATLLGDGGNVERGYDAEGGWGRDEAVTLLRQFYVHENGRAPVPRKKEGRAARLAAMMERDGHAGGPMIEAVAVLPNKKTGENSEESSDSTKGADCLESPLVDAGGESSS